MIKEFKLDYNLSGYYYHTCKEIIKPNMCYNTVYELVIKELKKEFHEGKVKIGFAYVCDNDSNTLYRHAVLTYPIGEVIDPCIMGRYIDDLKPHLDELNSRVYYVFAELNKEQYQQHLEADGGFPDLESSLHTSEQEIIGYAQEKGLVVNEYDMKKYLKVSAS